MGKSTIQWTDNTINPVRPKEDPDVPGIYGWFCQKVSGDPACANCYSEDLNLSSRMGGNLRPFQGQPPEMELVTTRLDEFLRKTKAEIWFWGSMTDLFGAWVPDAWLMDILDTAYAKPEMRSLFLTKRIDRAYFIIKRWLKRKGLEQLPLHIGIGTTIGNQRWANERLPWLVSIPAEFRFVSAEPLITGERTLQMPRYFPMPRALHETLGLTKAVTESSIEVFPRHSPVIHWVMMGGESGSIKKVRPFFLGPAEDFAKRLSETGAKVLWKQLGRYPIIPSLDRDPEIRTGWDLVEYMQEWPDGTTFGNRKTGAYYRPRFNGRQVILKHKKGGDWDEWAPRYRVREFPFDLASLAEARGGVAV